MTEREFRARTLVRVIWVSRTHMKICVPGWNPYSYFKVQKKLFPKFRFARGYRFHANVNLAAQKPSDLTFLPPYEEGNRKRPTLKSLQKKGIVRVTY